MTTDFRAPCAELLAALKSWSPSGGGPLEGKEAETEARLINRVSTLLAQPEPEGPTDEELDELAWNWYSKTGSTWYQIAAFRAFARAVLARWGRSDGPAVPNGREPASVSAEPSGPIPADGEVAELVAWLIDEADQYDCIAQAPDTSRKLRRAASLLEHLSPPQPIAVSERLPGPEDCDAERRCWWGEPQIGDSHDATWTLCTHEDAQEFLTRGTNGGWLPAHALPLPE